MYTNMKYTEMEISTPKQNINLRTCNNELHHGSKTNDKHAIE
jgi:hypothetical protein